MDLLLHIVFEKAVPAKHDNMHWNINQSTNPWIVNQSMVKARNNDRPWTQRKVNKTTNTQKAGVFSWNLIYQ